MQYYGLIGHPVKHSLSAYMHNVAFATLGIDARYELFDVAPSDLSSFMKTTLRERGLCGCNVTIPHKEAILAYVTEPLSNEVSLIGAANTLKIEDGGEVIRCLNTDGAGFARHVRECEITLADKAVAIIGAGGAAKAVSVYLAKESPKRIAIFDIVQEKASALAKHVKRYFSAIDIVAVDSIQALDIPQAALFVNASGIGMKPSDPCVVDATLLHDKLFVYDLIYNPPVTPLLREAAARGARTAHGLKMLLYQGVLAFEFWTGRKGPEEVMWNTLRSHLSGNS